MRRGSFVVSMTLILVLGVHSPALSSTLATCMSTDSDCLAFARLMETEQYQKITELADPMKPYSAEAKAYIGRAYLMLAGQEGTTPEQEELYCRKALAFDAVSAYMGLYFINADRSPEEALEYLREYIKTQPNDPVPYVILGEAELAQKNYEPASQYLAKARSVASGRSANIDWLLFQASYLAGDFTTASAMLDSSFSQGKTAGDLNALVSSDPRFFEIGKKSEFRKFFPTMNEAATCRLCSRP